MKDVRNASLDSGTGHTHKIMNKLLTTSILSLLIISMSFVSAFPGEGKATSKAQINDPAVAQNPGPSPSTSSNSGGGSATKGCKTAWAYNGKNWVKRPVEIHFTKTDGSEYKYTIPGSRCKTGPNPSKIVSLSPTADTTVKPVICKLKDWENCIYS